MRRHRTIASAPQRSAGEAWTTIQTLIADTLERSSVIERDDVDAELAHLAQVARMLISAGHLEKHSLVVLAGEMWLEISTVSGGPALTLEENLNPVPGGASASDWMLYVPQVEPMSKLVRDSVEGHAHLSADQPVQELQAAAKTGAGVDLEALARWAGEDT